ncbi:hypothetical protein [Tenacibaculum sp. M341]|uniref:hypothetical protein n=1 Tax=Tenacibaculum sp. M341 TaxID=2530339 RepID=UPI001049B454|nr:hypothetical protein [Tenacibaculum sp. M341]TCI84526.1 hypothetical protein EYW44_21010 [Tenacibaculum sp. M341]
MKKSLSLPVFLITIILIGCSVLTGKEVARLSINEVSTENANLIIKETSLNLKKDEEIAIWSDMDIEYEGDIALRFRLEILKDGEDFTRLEIDPTEKNITIGEIKTSLMNKTNWSFLGKNSEIKIEEDGNYTFRGILVSSKNPTLKVNKAEIVLNK